MPFFKEINTPAWAQGEQNWSKVTVNAFIMLQKICSNNCFNFLFLKVFTKTLGNFYQHWKWEMFVTVSCDSSCEIVGVIDPKHPALYKKLTKWIAF